MKKAKGRQRAGTAKKAARARIKNISEKPAAKPDGKTLNRVEEELEPVDFAEVREIVAAMVRRSAKKIAEGVIKVAEKGQLGPAKYLFEAVGLYPPGAEVPKPEESLAYSLLKRMGLQPEAEVADEGEKGNIQTHEPERSTTQMEQPTT